MVASVLATAGNVVFANFRAARVFADRCAAGIEANRERCEALVEQSLAMCTSLAPKIGYDKAADIAKESFKTGKTVRQLCLEKKVLPPAELGNCDCPDFYRITIYQGVSSANE